MNKKKLVAQLHDLLDRAGLDGHTTIAYNVSFLAGRLSGQEVAAVLGLLETSLFVTHNVADKSWVVGLELIRKNHFGGKDERPCPGNQ